MTTSSKNLTPKPDDGNWNELTATLSIESTDRFDEWMTEQLTVLEERLNEFVSPRSLHKNLRG
ncbi:hypothetical protein CA13_06370 [Planctomycetes bacterium CA13]|uniref:Uncharacterized protein n=1 Tax=Novipirellula herctigrandis TaxID=2527986 RepID=A0A5C5YVZ7_9BACT|nr:hypothetical protein CA13_06370 [Planctomycetes bacterium CA13]